MSARLVLTEELEVVVVLLAEAVAGWVLMAAPHPTLERGGLGYPKRASDHHD